MAKKRSVFARCFSAATRWMSRTYGDYGYTAGDTKHVAYRSGWYAGYVQARREMKHQGKPDER